MPPVYYEIDALPDDPSERAKLLEETGGRLRRSDPEGPWLLAAAERLPRKVGRREITKKKWGDAGVVKPIRPKPAPNTSSTTDLLQRAWFVAPDSPRDASLRRTGGARRSLWLGVHDGGTGDHVHLTTHSAMAATCSGLVLSLWLPHAMPVRFTLRLTTRRGEPLWSSDPITTVHAGRSRGGWNLEPVSADVKRFVEHITLDVETPVDTGRLRIDALRLLGPR